jgi:2-(1,2-epoxy-1,2-dihydrophenyl)acetyl-CoA isomerase
MFCIMSELLKESIEDRVAVVMMDAPEKINAMSLEMREALIDALQRHFMDDGCRAIVLCGAGGNFSSGGDIRGPRPAPEALARTVRHKLSRLQELVRLVTNGPKPVVAAVAGKAVGAGLSLAIACDAVIAADSAQFGAVFGKVGLVPDAGILYTLPRRVGAARAQHMLLSARIVEARQALDMGLVDAVVPAGELIARACAEARQLDAIAPLSLAAIKSLGTGGCASLEDAFAQEMRLQPLLVMSDDSAEARAAFAERRKPAFRGC